MRLFFKCLKHAWHTVMIIVIIKWSKWKTSIVWICNRKFLALLYAGSLSKTFSLFFSHTAVPEKRAKKPPGGAFFFLDRVLSSFALQGPLCFPESALEAWLPRDRRQATACTHTSGGPGSRQYGGSRHLLDLSAQPVSHIHVPARTSADPAPDLKRTLEVAPGVEGELPEPSASLRLPRELIAPRGVLWATGR